MKKFTLPQPPNPDDYRSPVAYNRAIADWMNRTKGALETAVNHLGSPVRPSFTVSSYTTNTTLSGTSTGTDLANGVCSLIAALTNKGITFSN